MQFTLVGSAVNEVVRVQDLTKKLGCPVLATASFAAAAPRPWRPLGERFLRGFEALMPILVMSYDAEAASASWRCSGAGLAVSDMGEADWVTRWSADVRDGSTFPVTARCSLGGK